MSRARTMLSFAAISMALAGCQAWLGPDERSGGPTQTSEPSTRPTSVPSSPEPTPSAGRSTPAELEWEELAERVDNGVVRIQVATCDDQPTTMGSGFVLGDHLVMTAAHVVEDAPTITIRSGDTLTAARVIRYDFPTDSALLYTDVALGGREVDLSSRPLAIGRELAVLGFPLGVNDLRISTGVVSGLDQPAEYEEFTVDSVFITDAATNGGNSGGPVFDHTGEVVGLVSGGQNWDGSGQDLTPVQGTNYIVPARTLIKQYRKWKGVAPPKQDPCGEADAPVEDSHTLKISVAAEHPDAYDITQALFVHGEAINDGDYAAAWGIFSPNLQDELPLDRWQQGLETSYWETLDVRQVTDEGTSRKVQVQFRTSQDAEFGTNGQTCSDWDITYTMLQIRGAWRIDGRKADKPTAC